MQAAVEAVEICGFRVLEVALSAEALLRAETEHQSVVGDLVDLEGILHSVARSDVELVGEAEPAAFTNPVNLRGNASNAS